MISKDQLVVVIRSAGERTESVCKELVLREVDESQVHVVRLVPFEAALKESYRIGIESGSKWLMTLDADVLLRENAITDFLSEAEAMSDKCFHTQGLIFDKFLGQYRSAGHRIYRSALLPKAIDLVPNDGVQIRPEHFTVNTMSLSGYPSVDSNTVFGIHDFEQYYSDVYRKCVVHGFKHGQEVISQVNKWKNSLDVDFKVALSALADSISFFEKVSIDTRIFSKRWDLVSSELSISEKGSFLGKYEIQKLVNQVLIAAGPVPELVIQIRTPQIPEKSYKTFVRKQFRGKSTFKALRYLFGQGIVKVGSMLRGE